jgi:hypothetical protein
MELAALTAIRDALRLKDCLLFEREGASRRYSAKMGLGVLMGVVREQPLVEAGGRDVFGISLTRREDVLIHDGTDEKLHRFIPQWLRNAGGPGSFILLPLQDPSGVFGLIFGRRTRPPPLQPSVRELQLLRAIRQHLATARRLAVP